MIPHFRGRSRRRITELYAAEAAECGLACLAMVAGFHGHCIDLISLRSRYPSSLSGMTLRGLIEAASSLRLAARPVRLDLNGLPKLRLPAIAHWDFCHFVVIEKATKHRVTVIDPSRGRRTVPMAEFSQSFTGVALELEPAVNFAEDTSRTRLKVGALWGGMQGWTSALVQILALSVALQLVTLAMPFQLQLLVDGAIARRDFQLLLVIGAGFGGLVLIRAISEFARGWAIQVLGSRISFQVLGKVVRHLLHLPGEYFQKRSVGDITSRLESGERLQDALTHGVVSAIVDGLASVLTLIVMLFYSIQLTAVIAGLVALQMVGVYLLLPEMQRRQEIQIRETASAQNLLMETVRAAATIKIMGGEPEREARWRNAYADVVNATNSSNKWTLGLNAWNTSLAGAQIVLVGTLAANLVMADSGFSLGMLFAFMAMRQVFSDRVSSLLGEFTKVRLLRVHLDRIGDIMLTPREAHDGEVQTRFGSGGRLRLKDVSYQYGRSDPLVLSNVDLELAAGDFVAITGRTGSGKSTLLHLMLGLIQPTSGTIEIDGQPASPAAWREWRRKVGVVMQDDQLLAGTLAENISFFDTEMDLNEVKKAAEVAQVHQDIEAFPMKYHTLVGDMGSTLSGGQKQRVLLARALYRKPQILFLDEGTSNLDLRTERVIADALDEMKITRVVIAHRRALAEKADRVFVVHDGKLYPHVNVGAEVATPSSTFAE